MAISEAASHIDDFFDHPILNSPYGCPDRHWQLTPEGLPTQRINPYRRPADFITPIPKPKKQKRTAEQGTLFEQTTAESISTSAQEYHKALINEVRAHVTAWRALPQSQWKVSPETARLLQHWRHHKFNGIRPFFCQVEAIETAIWLTEVAPHSGKKFAPYLEHIHSSNEEAIQD